MIKPFLFLICLLFIILNFIALSLYGEGPMSWNALPGNVKSNPLPVNSISVTVGQVEPPGVAPGKSGSEVITVRLSKTAADLEMMKRMPLGRKTIGGQSDKPVSGEKPPACTMYAGKYGALYLGGGVSLSTVIFKSQNSGKYDRLIVDMNNDKDFSNDKVIEVPADGVGKELNIKVGTFDDTFIIRNLGGGASYFMLDYKYWMKGEADYHGKKIQAVLTPNQDGRYSFSSQLFLDINDNGKMDYSYAVPGQASSGKIQEMF
jgi:hypothetical protein